jgi:hypothetical protein
MLCPSQIEAAATTIIGILREAARNPGHVLDGTVAAKTTADALMAEIGCHDPRSLFRSMDAVVRTACGRLGDRVVWDHDGVQGLSKVYLFNAPVACFANPDPEPDTREQGLREALAKLCRRGVQTPDGEMVLILLTRDEVSDITKLANSTD